VSERDLDVVVFGASSITGRRVAAYLAGRAGEVGARWAAAGRNREKVEGTLAEVGVEGAETIVADLGDPPSLEAMARRARVVLNLAGPYTTQGRPVIEACVGARAHYVDLSGEIPFVRRMVDAFDGPAATAGVKVVQVCGFEALPPDLAILLAAETARERWGESLAEVDSVVTVKPLPGMPLPSDMLSGGTMQSMAEVVRDEDAAAITDPAALVDDPQAAAAIRRRSPISLRPRRRGDGTVIGPMAPAAFINPAVVHRTNALLAAERGEAVQPFRFREGVGFPGAAPSVPIRYAVAGTLAGVQAGMSRLAGAGSATRRRAGNALSSIFPSAGFGPRPDRLEGWRWRMTVEARTGGGRELVVTVDGEGHPGYLTTATMLGEAGLMLAEANATPDRAGCLTPATALGTAGIERFERARLRFSTAMPT
jgi:short subunit dehydrogenase-like uncharacterized protein